MESADCSLPDVIGSGHLRALGVRGKRHQLWPQNSYPRWVMSDAHALSASGSKLPSAEQRTVGQCQN